MPEPQVSKISQISCFVDPFSNFLIHKIHKYLNNHFQCKIQTNKELTINIQLYVRYFLLFHYSILLYLTWHPWEVQWQLGLITFVIELPQSTTATVAFLSPSLGILNNGNSQFKKVQPSPQTALKKTNLKHSTKYILPIFHKCCLIDTSS